MNRESFNSLLSMEPDDLTDSQKLRFTRPLRLNLPNSQEFGGFISNDADLEPLTPVSVLEDNATSLPPSILKSNTPSHSSTQKRAKVKKTGKEKLKDSDKTNLELSSMDSSEGCSDETSIKKGKTILTYEIMVDDHIISSPPKSIGIPPDKSN
jgi:hypothetical protein